MLLLNNSAFLRDFVLHLTDCAPPPYQSQKVIGGSWLVSIMGGLLNEPACTQAQGSWTGSDFLFKSQTNEHKEMQNE